MAQKIAILRTSDSNEDISSWCNLTTRPLACAALFIAESGLERYAWRDKTAEGIPDDVSGGLVQVSIQYMPQIKPPGYNPKMLRNSLTNIRAWQHWSWDIPSQMAWFLPHFDKLAGWAEMGLGRGGGKVWDDTEENIDLLTCLLWNAPNLGILRNMAGLPYYPVEDTRQRVAVANYWLAPGLKSLDPQHGANRDNYMRSLNEAHKYLADDGSSGNGGGTIMPDITDYMEPTFREYANSDGSVNLDMLAACVDELQRRVAQLDKQQHIQTDTLGIVGNPDYGLADIQSRVRNMVKTLRGG